MKSLATVLFCLCLPLMAADKKPLTKEESVKVIEAAIRNHFSVKKPTGELTKADLEKVKLLSINRNQLASVKGLEKLTQLRVLTLVENKLNSVKGLEKLDQLRELYLMSNQLADVKGLEKRGPKPKAKKAESKSAAPSQPVDKNKK